jgi:hypothetical protein
MFARPFAAVEARLRPNFTIPALVLHFAMKLASVFLFSTVKFLAGPLAGNAMGLGFWPTLGLTVAGMMTSVFIISGVGRIWVRHRQMQRRLRRAPVFSKRTGKPFEEGKHFKKSQKGNKKNPGKKGASSPAMKAINARPRRRSK